MSRLYEDDDNEDKKSYQRMIALCVAAASVVMLIFLLVLYANDQREREKNKQVAKQQEVVKEEEFIEENSNLKSEDLHFWKNYESEEGLNESNEGSGNKTEYEKGRKLPGKSSDDENINVGRDKDDNDADKDKTDKSFDDGDKTDSDSPDSMTDNPDDADADVNADDKHIAVSDENGKRVLYEILEEVPKNNLKLEDNLKREGERISYSDSVSRSITGIDLSKYNGSVDFAKVKSDNISFVMLRLGARGYESGTIALDDKFVEYAQGCIENDIPMGAYFYSQAVNENEAVEEANYTVGAITNFGITYPVAIDVEKVDSANYRTKDVTVSERTKYVKLFCDTVSAYGYKPIIYAKRDMLITGLDLKELIDYDIWLADTNVPTDFPYKYKMWQYSNNGSVSGISGSVDLNIMFEDTAER